MGSDWPPFVYADRALIRALLRYVRRLERDVAEMGEFWWFAFCNGCPSVFQTLRQPGTNSSRWNWQQAANGTCVGVAFAAVVHPHQHAHAAHPVALDMLRPRPPDFVAELSVQGGRRYRRAAALRTAEGQRPPNRGVAVFRQPLAGSATISDGSSERPPQRPRLHSLACRGIVCAPARFRYSSKRVANLAA